MCRLVSGSYYCGALSTSSPYKGLADTADTPHVGGDSYYEPGSRHAKAPTGTHLYDAANYAKAPTVANPDYYTRGTLHEYVQEPENNGQRTAHPTHTVGETTAIFSNGNIGADIESRFKFGENDGNPQKWSNYAMRHAAAELYNGGVHIAQGGAMSSAPIWVVDASNKDCSPSTSWFGRQQSAGQCKALCAEKGYTYAIVASDFNCKCAAANQCSSRTDFTNYYIYRKSDATSVSSPAAPGRSHYSVVLGTQQEYR